MIRSQIGTIERVLARSGVWTKLESGTSTPLISCSWRTATAGSLKRSSQTTSLATSRSACDGEQRARRGGVLRALGAPEALGEAGEAGDAELERFERRLVGGAQRPGRIEPFGARDADLLLRDETVKLLLQLGGLDPGRRQHVAELAPDAIGLARDGRDVLHVVAVRVVLLVLLAALRPEQEQHDDQDREGDQAEQAQQRREAGARADRAPRGARTARASQWTAERALTARGLPGFGLLEEVELEVWLALSHGSQG